MKKFKIFAGSSAQEFTKKVADYLGIEVGKNTVKTFSCGETYVKFDESFRGHEVFIVQTGRTGKMNDDLMELFLMIDAAKQSFAEKIHIVLPYYPYCRQDKIHEPREGISAKLFADLIVKSGADRVITMHLHSNQIQGFFDCPVDNLHPRRLLVEYFSAKDLQNAVIVSPDAGGAKEAKKFADELGVPLVIMHKSRPKHNESEVNHVIGDVEGKIPIIIDDIVDTAGSVCAAKKALLANGSSEDVYLVATHPVFSGPAIDRLNEANFKEIVCTDTLGVENPPRNFQVITVTELLGEVIKNVAEQQSVSKLYM